MGRTPQAAGREQRGVTVIELLVVLSLMGVLLMVATPTLRSVFGADQRAASRELAAALRYVYDESVVRNVPMRVAYDLDHNAWWVEAADGPARIFNDRDQREAFAEWMAEKAESDEKVAETASRKRTETDNAMSELMAGMMGEDGQMPGGGGGGLLGGLFGGGGLGAPQRGGEFQVNQFHPLGDDDGDEAMGRHDLPRGVFFKGVWTPQYDEMMVPLDDYELEAMMAAPVEEQVWTIVYTHVFPGGYIEDTVVMLSDDEGGDVTSLIVEPLTGRVTMEKGEAELPDLREREQR